MDLKERFAQNCSPFTQDHNLIEKLWQEIEKKYAEKSRHYHNLEHLGHMFRELDAVKEDISNFTNISFSVFYHDIVYDASSKKNEEKSADLAQSRLQLLSLNIDDISEIHQQILATKSHQKSEKEDTNLLLDADLSVLGKDAATYTDYTKKIRKEYAVYPDFLYNPGRKKILQHFLQWESIFKTEVFKAKYETKARENIVSEIERL